MPSRANVERGKASLEEARERARRDEATRSEADSLVQQMRVLRAQDHFADRVRLLFRSA